MKFTHHHRIKIQAGIVMLVLGVGLGWLFVVQFKTAPARTLNPVTPYISLTQAQATLTRDQEETKKKIKTLREEIKNLQEDAKKQKKTSKDLVEEIEKYKDQIGLTEKKSKGLVITLADSSKEGANINSIIHAADLRDLTNTLWLNGAQVISINDQRLVSSSSIDSIINTILVNNTKIINPFVIRVIGDQKRMQAALAEASELQDIRKRASDEGLIFNIEKSPEVSISVFESNFSVNFAKLAE